MLLVGLTVLVLAQQKTEPYEIFGIPIPVSATHMLIVLSMLYLLIDFGSTLKFLIYERMALWKLVDVIEGPVSAERSVGIASLRPLLHGKSFLDGWFVTFLPEFSLRWVSADADSYRAVNHVLNAFIWGTGAAMIGLAHASAFAVLENGGNLWRDNRLVRYGVPIGLLLIAGVILGCYLWFQLDGQGRWFFVACSVAAGAFIIKANLSEDE